MPTVHTKESIQALLDRNEQAVYRAMHAIQARQTADEQAGHHTRHTNGIGWSKFDAPWMAEMIDKQRRWGTLLPKPLSITRNKVKRYWRQLLEIANENYANGTVSADASFAGVAKAEARSVPATMPSVSPEGVGDYRTLRPRMCGCEENDGEVKFEDCDRCMGSEFGSYEAELERRAFADKERVKARAEGSW